MARPPRLRRRAVSRVNEADELDPDYVQTDLYSGQRYRPYREEMLVDSEERSSNRLIIVIIVLLVLLAGGAGGYQYRQSIYEWPISVWLRNWWYGIKQPPPPRRYYLMVAQPNAPLRAEPHREALVTAHLPLYYQALMLGQTQQNGNGEIWYKVRVGPDAQAQEGWLYERDVFRQPPNNGL